VTDDTNETPAETAPTTSALPAFDPAQPCIIRADALAHVAKFAGEATTTTTRPILSGVLIEPCGVIVATNGHVLMAWPHAAENVGPRARWLSLPRPALQQLRRAARHSDGVLLLPTEAAPHPIDTQPPRRAVVARVYGGARMGHVAVTVDVCDDSAVTFPTWRSVVPRPSALTDPAVDARATFNLEYLARLQFGEDIVPPRLYGSDPTRAYVVRYPVNSAAADAVGIVMPVNDTSAASPREVPEWLADSATINYRLRAGADRRS
jgi:hypothetical protein